MSFILLPLLQVFFSLGCLRDKVEEAVAAAAASLGTDVSDALTNIDARAARGGRAGWVAALWGQVEAVGELLLGAATRLCLLTRVLSKRRGSLEAGRRGPCASPTSASRGTRPN